MHGFKSGKLLLETSCVYLTLYLVCFPSNMVSSAHAQANNQYNRTSGCGSRASHRTTFHDISALRSLFVGAGLQITVAPSGREGEKCHPLDHMWQIPFIHPAQSPYNQFLYILKSVLVNSSIWYVQACLGVTRNQQLGVRYCGNTHLRFRGFILVKCSSTWQALAWIGTNSICECRFAWMKLDGNYLVSPYSIFGTFCLFWGQIFITRTWNLEQLR